MLLWNMSNFIWIFRSCRPAFGLDPVDIIKPTPVTVALIRYSHGKTWDGPIRIQLKMVAVGSCQISGRCKMDLRKRKPAQPTEELVIQARREHHSKADVMLWTICTKKEGFPVCVLWLLGKVAVGTP